MKRRHFLGALAAAGIVRPPPATAADVDNVADVDPYFLQSGDVPATDRAGIEDLVAFQERELEGQPAIRPRGRPKLAPTYRFLKWDGDIDGPGSFQGPLSVAPALPRTAAYQLNAQILGFHAAGGDWGGRTARGTLTVEFRTRLDGEPMTWLFAQQFDVGAAGRSTLSLEFLGQRDGVRDPIVTDDINIDMRIQLIRHRGKATLLKKIMQIVSFVVGLPTAGLTGPAAALAEALPVIRVPRLLREGVAFSQAFFGGMTDELPIWRSGFTTFALADGGSRLALSPGLWVVIDEAREVDLRGAEVRDLGGRLGLVRDGVPVDANHLVLSIGVSEAVLTGYGRVVTAASDTWVEKGLPADQPLSRGLENEQ